MRGLFVAVRPACMRSLRMIVSSGVGVCLCCYALFLAPTPSLHSLCSSLDVPRFGLQSVPFFPHAVFRPLEPTK